MVLSIERKCKVHGVHTRWYKMPSHECPRCCLCKVDYNRRIRATKPATTKNMTYTPLEVALILNYANKYNSCCIKVKENLKAKTFLLILYDHIETRPAVRLPLGYWERCKLEERDICDNPNESRRYGQMSWIKSDSFKEINRTQLAQFISSRK